MDNNINIEDEIKSIKDTIEFLKKLMQTEKIIEMKNNNLSECKGYLAILLPTFYESYPTLFNNVIEDKELGFLDEMLEGITQINNNYDLKGDIEKDLGEKLAEKFLYPYVKKK